MPKSSQRKSKKVNKTTTKKRVNKNKKRSNRNKRSQSQRGGSVSSTTTIGIPTGNAKELLEICLEACKIMTPMIREFYIAISGGSNLKNLKGDESVFTIADGLVQYLLKDILFKDKFMGIVGEEDAIIDLTGTPYKVDDIVIPEIFNTIIDKTKTEISKLALQVNYYSNKYVFIDPIDGTREFGSEKGYESTVCIGFSNSDGTVWAGIVYRPIPLPESTEIKTVNDLNKNKNDLSTITYAYGCKAENINVQQLDKVKVVQGKELSPSSSKSLTKYSDKQKIKNPKLLTSNGIISPFLIEITKKWERIGSGGAGNKMLMVLEGKGTAYIQDRGVSRWDTCAAEAVINAYGGVCSKLTSILKNNIFSSYTYKETDTNLDYDNCYDINEQNKPYLTMYNYNKTNSKFIELDKEKISVFNKNRAIFNVSYFTPYINLCGIVAYLNPMYTDEIMTMLKEVSDSIKPEYS